MTNPMFNKTFRRIESDLASTKKRLSMQPGIVRQALESGGGAHDNAVYDDAMATHSLLVTTRDKLISYLTNVRIIEKFDTPKNYHQVNIGCQVWLKNIATSEPKEIVLGGAIDAEFDETGKVTSALSPMGQAILGASVGEKISVATPNGKIDYLVVGLKARFDAQI